LRRKRFVLSCPSAVAENQPANKHRMNPELSSFAARLRGAIATRFPDVGFEALALELFGLQFKYNPAYQKICAARGLTPQVVKQWTQIPAVPTTAFKELELTSILPDECTAVFHSSGTTERKPSRHFHSAESLAVYEASLWQWFRPNILRSADSLSASFPGASTGITCTLIFLTPPPAQAPHSSLIHMFEAVRRNLGLPDCSFLGQLADDNSWALDFNAAIEALQSATDSGKPVTLLGTAFSFVHLLDHLAENNLHFHLPAGSRVMETGGYKNRSRVLPKDELHALITERLGVPAQNIVCEYGMSELSSQAYDTCHPPFLILIPRIFHFPPWARVQIISPETGREVADGETGLIRIFDLANVYSVAAIQTEDLGIRRGDGFELIGRAQLAEPRGCSLMTT